MIAYFYGVYLLAILLVLIIIIIIIFIECLIMEIHFGKIKQRAMILNNSLHLIVCLLKTIEAKTAEN